MSDPRRYVYTSTGSTTRKLTEEELNRVAERLRSVSAGFDQASGSVFGGFYGFGKGESVAERAWEQHGGVVACECDDLDCEWILELNKTEYCAASGVGGMYRLTHPQCQVGILGYRLIERGERWLTWNREW